MLCPWEKPCLYDMEVRNATLCFLNFLIDDENDDFAKTGSGRMQENQTQQKGAFVSHTQLDKTEHHDVAETNPTVVKELMTMFEALDSEYHPPIENPEE